MVQTFFLLVCLSSSHFLNLGLNLCLSLAGTLAGLPSVHPLTSLKAQDFEKQSYEKSTYQQRSLDLADYYKHINGKINGENAL